MDKDRRPAQSAFSLTAGAWTAAKSFHNANSRWFRRPLLGSTALAGVTIISVTTVPGTARAQSVWSGASSAYGDAANWTGGSPPVLAGGTAFFESGGSSLVSVAGSIWPSAWIFDAASQSYTIQGGIVSFSSPGVNGGIINNANLGQTISISSIIGEFLSPGVMVQQLGASKLVLSGTNTYTGGTTINAGTVTANNNSALGTGAININGGTLRSDIDTTLPNGIFNSAEGSSIFAAAAGKTLTLSFSGTGAADSGVLAGHLTFGSATDTGTVVFGGYGGGWLGDSTYEVVGGTLSAGTSPGLPFVLSGGGGANFNVTTIVRNGATLDLVNFPTTIARLQGDAGATVTTGTGALTINEGNYAGDITAAHTLTKATVGTLILSGTNTYTGGTAINAGTLQIDNVNALGNGDMTLGGGTLIGNATGTLMNSIAFATGATSTIAATAGNTLTLGGLDFNRLVNRATLHFGTAGVTSTVVLAPTFRIGSSGSGSFLVDGGTLRTANIGGVFALSRSSITVASGATLDFNDQVGAEASDLYGGGTVWTGASTGMSVTVQAGNFAGGVQGAGSLLVGCVASCASDTLILSGTGLNTYAGTTTIGSGLGSFTLQGGAVDAFNAGSATTVSAAGTLDLGGFSQTIGSLAGSGTVSNSVGGAAMLTTGGNNLSTAFAGVIKDGQGTLGLAKTGSGALTLSGNNTYTGATTVKGGTLAVVGNGSIAASSGLDLSGAGATFDIAGANGNVVLGDLAGVSSTIIHLGGNSLVVGTANSTTFAGVMENGGTGGGLSKIGSGTLTLSGVNTYTGATTVNAGTLLVNGSIASSALTTVNVGATLGGNGTVGATEVYGTLSPGNSPGTLTVAGDLALKAGSTSVFELSTPGVIGDASNDLVKVSNNLALGGTLQTTNAVSGYYRLFDVGGAVSGAFAAVPAGATVTSDIPHQVNLLLNQGGQLVQFWDGGDMSGNGTVDGGTGTWNAANTNWTGAPGQADINDHWRGEVGVFAGAAGTVTTSGPLAFQGLQFKTDGYRLAGDALTMTGDLHGNAAASFVNVDGGVTATIAAALTGAGIGLDKLGNGTLVLAGTNTYTGTTTVAAGTLQAGATNAFAAQSAHEVNVGARLDLAGHDQTIGSLIGGGTVQLGSGVLTTGGNNASTSFNGAIEGAGSLVKVGTGFFGLLTAGTWSGGLVARDGQVGLGHDQALGTGALTLDGGVAQAMANGLAIANAIHVTGHDGGIDNAGYTLTLNGAISGGGDIRFTDSGNLVTPGSIGRTIVTADNSGWSGHAGISGAGIAVAHNKALGSGAVELDDSGLIAGANNLTLANPIALHATPDGNIIDNGGTRFTLAGSLGNATPGQGGNVVFGGSGTTVLEGTGSYTGFTHVRNGTLSVNGSIASSSLMTVEAGATLGGNGTVGNTTINGGTLSPGNSIGALTVTGNLVMTAASIYMVEVSPTNSDFTHVIGTATLGGATVQAQFAPGSYVEKRYTILTADSGLNDTFSGPVNTNLPANLESVLVHDTNNAYLDLALSFRRDGLNANQQSIADALVNSFNRNGGIPLAFGALDPRGLSLASGEIANTASQAAFDAQSQFLNTLTDPFAGGYRGNTSAAGSSSPALGYAAAAGESNPRDAFAALVTKAPPQASSFEQRWRTFGAAYGGNTQIGGNAALGSHDATSRVYGAMGGASYALSPATELGFAFGGGGTSFVLAGGMGSGRSDMFQAGVFAHHGFARNGYLSGAFAYGWHDVTADRTVATGERLRGAYKAGVLSGRLETGWRIDTAWAGMTPYAAAQAISYRMPSYLEQGNGMADSFALGYAARDVTATRSELGLRLDRTTVMGDTLLTLRGRAAWAHNFDTARNAAATFQALPGSGFLVNGAAMAPNAALVSTGAEIAWRNGFALAASFEGEFSNNVTSYTGKGTLRYAW